LQAAAAHWKRSPAKQAEIAVRDSELRFRMMADMPAMLWVTTLGECTFLSRGWYGSLANWKPAGLPGAWKDATHPDDREQRGRSL
jgi:hypothetical protein